MRTLVRIFQQADRLLAAVLKWVCIVLFAALTVLLTAGILVRIVPLFSMHWFDEIVELIFASLVFYGAAALWRIRGHFSVGDWVSPRLSNPRARHAYRLVIELLSLLFLGVLLWYATKLTTTVQDVTNALQLPKAVLYFCMPISAAIMVVYSLRNIVVESASLLGRQAADR